ncbi:MAG: Fic family protein, partial [Dehalococcoidia bacterium]|nr:Fic family protein [Dehalococcoidia bacterium]
MRRRLWWDSIGQAADSLHNNRYMDSTTFSASPYGRIVHTRTGYDAFVPNPLPPPVSWTNGLAASLERASSSLASLAGSPVCSDGLHLPLLLARDALGGVRSEGKRLTMAAYLEESATNSHTPAGRLTANYIAAIGHGRNRFDELPLSLRLLKELHFLLVSGVVDPRTTPGEFRRSQNWLGSPGCTLSSATFVPPPQYEMQALLDKWERFLHEENDLPVLIRLSWAHFQYMVIQP